jgi:very-short-patch-repair endonuclease
VAALVGAQRGLITASQLRGLGVSASATSRAVAAGSLHRIHRGVYGLLPPNALPAYAGEQAALLAYGRGTVLSHRTAAALWGLRPAANAMVEITVVGRDARSRAGIGVHCAATIDRRDVRRRDGLLLTAPARTLLDLSPTLTDRRLERAFDEALLTGIMRRSEARAMVERHPGRAGIARLRALAFEDRATTWTRQHSEERFLALVRRAGLPGPEVNTQFDRFELDFYWPEHRLAVEVDGATFHAHRRALERDHRRDAALQLAGVLVIRFTWRQIRDEPETVIAELATALATRAAAA